MYDSQNRKYVLAQLFFRFSLCRSFCALFYGKDGVAVLHVLFSGCSVPTALRTFIVAFLGSLHFFGIFLNHVKPRIFQKLILSSSLK